MKFSPPKVKSLLSDSVMVILDLHFEAHTVAAIDYLVNGLQRDEDSQEINPNKREGALVAMWNMVNEDMDSSLKCLHRLFPSKANDEKFVALKEDASALDQPALNQTYKLFYGIALHSSGEISEDDPIWKQCTKLSIDENDENAIAKKALLRSEIGDYFRTKTNEYLKETHQEYEGIKNYMERSSSASPNSSASSDKSSDRGSPTQLFPPIEDLSIGEKRSRSVTPPPRAFSAEPPSSSELSPSKRPKAHPSSPEASPAAAKEQSNSPSP